MAFWSTQRIEAEQKKHSLVDPFSSERIKHGAYELALSREVLTTPDGLTVFSSSPSDPALRIPPGQFALLYTDERVKIPKDAIAFISMKGSVKFKGLINISGFQVDPGFLGNLKFSVYNASGSDVHLNYGEACFLIWFADLDAEIKDPYNGEHKNQKSLTSEDRDRMSRPNLSPAALQKRMDEMDNLVEMRMDKLEHHLNVFMWVSGTILAGLLLPLFVGVAQPMVNRFFEGPSNKSSQLQTNENHGLPLQVIPSQSQSSTTASQSPVAHSQTQTNGNVVPKAATNP